MNVDPENLLKQTQNEVSWWKIAARTTPFVAMFTLILCVLFADAYVTLIVAIVTIIYVAVSVAWWWWAIEKILRVTKIMFDTTKKFEEVQEELKKIKNDVGDRKR